MKFFGRTQCLGGCASLVLGCILCFGAQCSSAGGESIISSIDKQGRIGWTGAGNQGITVIEIAPATTNPQWAPWFYALPSDGSAFIPPPANPAFFRLKTSTNPPDQSLVLHFTFDNAFTNGWLLDCSVHNNHGIRYGSNRWPSVIDGPDGSQAGEFHEYYDGYGKYGKSGDYVVVQHNPTLLNLTQATFSAWAWYYTAPSNNYSINRTCTIVDGLYQGASYGWRLGRSYTDNTRFEVSDSLKETHSVLSFPDSTSRTGGNSGGWNLYTVTFDGLYFRGYFNGQLFQTTETPGVTNLVAGGTYIGLGTWNFGRSPVWDDTDGYPNAGWMNGGIDDLRIYNRALSSDDVMNLFLSYQQSAHVSN